MSHIEWTEKTWNPVVGCTKVSPGCKHCYAEVMHARLTAMKAPGYEQDFNAIRMLDNKLKEPAKRKKPTTYFVNSMADLFHVGVSLSHIDAVMDTIRRTPQHTYQVLTKRSDRLVTYFMRDCHPENLWLGVSVEDWKYGVPRIDDLREAKVKTRFLSVEPLLEDLGKLDLSGIHWVIVGGESGAKARPMNPEWARNIRDQCIDQGVPFLFKQWGSFGEDGVKRNKKVNGRLLDGVLWDQYPNA